MQIDQASVQLSSERIAIQKQTVKESLKVWVGERPPAAGQAARSNQPAVEIRLSSQARAAAKTKRAEKLNDDSDDTIADPKLRTIKLLLEIIYGKKIDLFGTEPNQSAEESAPAENTNWGVEYDYEQSYHEAERTDVSAEGLIRTADGQEIQFKLTLSMSREFMTQQEFHLRMGQAAKDPLVVNFDGTAAQLSSSQFFFDLDSDGRLEETSFVSPNSGFLTLDRNEDGRINNGSELFGPTTGHGFTELAAYDEDGNNWLDENDSVFTRLRVWSRDGQGSDTLFSLADKGIGAIYLQPIGSEFSLKDSQNQLLGQVRSTSIYLGENGSAGTVQQVDLAV